MIHKVISGSQTGVDRAGGLWERSVDSVQKAPCHQVSGQEAKRVGLSRVYG